MGEADDIPIEQRGAITIVTLKRPERRNCMTAVSCIRSHDAARAPFPLPMVKADRLAAQTRPTEALAQLETARMAESSTSGTIREGIAGFWAQTT
jgi:hypothetical protein